MKPGKILTIAEARTVAEEGRLVWFKMIQWRYDDHQYEGPAGFKKSQHDAGFLIFEANKLVTDESYIIEFDFDEWKDDVLLSQDFADGDIEMRELVGD